MWFVLLSSLFFSFSFAWSLPFLLITLFKWQLYQIKAREKVILVSSKVRHSSIKKEEDKPSGIFIGYMYVGIFIEKGYCPEILLLCSVKKYKELTTREKTDDEEEEKTEEIIIYERYGSFNEIEYSKRKLNVINHCIREKQEPIIDNIIKLFNSKKFCTALIYGNPGSGKSMISLLLAKKLKGSLVQTFNPTDPGNTIASLYNTVNPTKNKPLVIVFDEVDIMLENIHYTKIPRHKTTPIQITDKTSWNGFFDNINKGYYPYIILVMTSNIFLDNLEIKYEKSYIREGRVDIKCEL